jgi:ribosomal protein L16/L10AE
MFEISGVPIEVAKEALRLAAQKLPVKQSLLLLVITSIISSNMKQTEINDYQLRS